MGINVLRDVPMKNVPPPIQRSMLIRGTASIGISEEEQMDFFRSIQHPRFLQIRKATGDGHIDDAFHLWTAEEASLDVLLTMDRHFWNVVNHEKKKIDSAVLVIPPKQLCERLCLEATDTAKMAAEINPFS